MNGLLTITSASVLFLFGICLLVLLYDELIEAEDATIQARHNADDHKIHLELVSAELEVAKAKAHTHSVVAGLEDTTAIAIDVSIGLEAELARVHTLINKLGTLREGPYSYNKDMPSGLDLSAE